MHSRPEFAVEHANVTYHALVGVEVGIENQRLQRLRRRTACGGGTRATMASRISSIPMPSLALAGMAVSPGIARMSSNCWLAWGTSACGRSILLITGMIVRFCFIARCTLATVWASTPCAASTDQQSPLARAQAARNLIGKINMSRGVDQVQLIGFPVSRLVTHRYRMRLDGDPPLPFQVHGIQQLVLHLPRGNGPRPVQQPVRQASSSHDQYGQ